MGLFTRSIVFLRAWRTLKMPESKMRNNIAGAEMDFHCAAFSLSRTFSLIPCCRFPSAFAEDRTVQLVCVQLPTSAVNVVLPELAAECRAAIDRYFTSAGRSAANPQQLRAAGE